MISIESRALLPLLLLALLALLNVTFLLREAAVSRFTFLITDEARALLNLGVGPDAA